jgi:peptidoglycan-N-acetylglucosamine deacetylase
MRWVAELWTHSFGPVTLCTMNRRKFLRLAAATPLVCSSLSHGTSQSPEIAFTFDDPKLDGGAGLQWQDINERLLHTLAARKLHATLFVCGKRVDQTEGRQLITQWDQAGHAIANHSYSHLYFNASGGAGSEANVTLAQFEADAFNNEPLISGYANFTRLFRFPFFKEGDTVEKRDGMRVFLKQHGYRIGRATIDASDWAISARMEARAKKDSSADPSPYRDFFLQHIWERAQFYDSLSRRTLGRSVRHTVLLHYNPLNARFLDDLIGMFMAKGWRPVDASYAYSDEVYDQQPNILPAGESLMWALAKQSGKFENELRYPGEDDVYENPKMDALKL